jgi:hypothetical protein
VPAVAAAEPERAIGPTPPRLAVVEGEVSFWRTGAEDWTPAVRNTALAAGDALYTAGDGRIEMELTSRAFVRADAETELRIESLELGYLQLSVPAGRVAVDLGRLPAGQVVEVDTPHGAFTIEDAGYYRVDVDGGTRFAALRGGQATMVLADGAETVVRDGQQATVRDGVPLVASAPIDDWDRWNWARAEEAAAPSPSVRYVPPAIAGAGDLDRYGDWRDTSSYGAVWVPRGVAADWAPYSTGRWVWDAHYGWTWIDDAPWGWAPYHYGRWCWLDSYWGWAPGPLVAAPVYAPALVAFFGSHGNVSISVGVYAPAVSWVALGYGEPILPWWGPPGFIGRPFWGGWGGRRYVNGAYIGHRHLVDVHHVRHYRNWDVHHARIVTERGHFGRGHRRHHRLTREHARDFDLVRGRPGVRPVAASLTPRERHARRPRDDGRPRSVVATRRPQDVGRRLRAAGLSPGDRRIVESRVVPRRDRSGERGERRVGNGPPPRDERGRMARERGAPGSDRRDRAEADRPQPRRADDGNRTVRRVPDADQRPGQARGVERPARPDREQRDRRAPGVEQRARSDRDQRLRRDRDGARRARDVDASRGRSGGPPSAADGRPSARTPRQPRQDAVGRRPRDARVEQSQRPQAPAPPPARVEQSRRPQAPAPPRARVEQSRRPEAPAPRRAERIAPAPPPDRTRERRLQSDRLPVREPRAARERFRAPAGERGGARAPSMQRQDRPRQNRSDAQARAPRGGGGRDAPARAARGDDGRGQSRSDRPARRDGGGSGGRDKSRR